MEKEENILGYEKIGKLMRKFSIPCIISLLVNSLYNIVDQIFIGWGVGYLGNGATNIVFPIVMIALAFSLIFLFVKRCTTKIHNIIFIIFMISSNYKVFIFTIFIAPINIIKRCIV